jgi:Flp pilus assembly protein TadG
MLAVPVRQRRRASSALECAIVYPATFFFVLAIIIGGTGVFRYQEVAHLAREGARYAATHGGQYNADGYSGQIINSADMLTYLSDRTTLLDPNDLTVTIDYVLDSDSTGTISTTQKASPVNMPTYTANNPNAVAPTPQYVTVRNNAVVTVTYTWIPEMYIVGPFTLTSTAQIPMSY